MDKTIEYYNNNSKQFSNNTQAVDFKETQDVFLSYLEDHAYILDFGCGAGRDTKYFLDHGYKVDAIDGSKEMCEIAHQFTGIPVKQMLFQDLNDKNKYDGIWACASILHVHKNDLKDVISKMVFALKNDGIIYTSFKYGEFEGERNGRYFTYLTNGSFKQIVKEIKNIEIVKEWITSDVRKDRGEEKWLNLILKKTNS